MFIRAIKERPPDSDGRSIGRISLLLNHFLRYCTVAHFRTDNEQTSALLIQIDHSLTFSIVQRNVLYLDLYQHT